MNLTARLAVVVCLGMSTAWGNGQPDVPRPARSAAQLIEQLGHEDYTQRDAASKALLALGAQALPALKKAKDHEDPEVRRRVGELILTVERAGLLAPRRVTLRLKDKPIRQAVTELARQTGYTIELWPNAQANGEREKELFRLDLENVPFWEAIDRICAAGGLALQEGYGDDRIRLNYASNRVPFVHRSGPFRLVAQGIHYNRSITFIGLPKDSPEPGQRHEHMSFMFNVSVEPRFPLLGVGQARVEAAEDDRNHLMVPPETNQPQGMAYYNGGYKSYTQQAQVTLVRGARGAQVVKLLRGHVPLTLLMEQKQDLVVEKVLTAKGKKFKSADANLAIDDVTETGAKQYQVKLSVTKQGENNPNDYTWRNSLYQRLELQDAKGNKYMSQGFTEANFSPAGVNGTFLFGDNGNADLGPPVKLIYYTWATLQHTVSFEFKDLPLP
jgi:hypothetical protein